jgi:hypothetical protein
VGYRSFFDLGGRRARALYLAPGEGLFRSRQALGLEYACRSVRRLRTESARRDRIIGRYGWQIEAVRPIGMPTKRWVKIRKRLGLPESTS